ncbi:hypothetical protein EMMF5_000101 [Cystobasidiomycetes sp. EMM_F5]
MADCVFPTRTARFGLALTFDGHLNLRLQKYSRDFGVIDPDCPCPTCLKGKGLSRSYIHHLAARETVGAHAVTLHNLAYQHRLMDQVRQAIVEDRYPAYLKTFFKRFFKTGENAWCVNALREVGVDLLEDQPGVVPAGNTQWDHVA